MPEKITEKPVTEYLHPVDNYAGLKGKYLVFKADTGEQVENCFVLRPEKDTAAVEALRAYVRNTDNETLAEDIYNWVGKGEPAQEWISVKDRLPEKNEMVFVYCKDKTIRGLDVRHIGSCDNGFWFLKTQPGTASFPHPEWEVTHWMHLPQPPKED